MPIMSAGDLAVKEFEVEPFLVEPLIPLGGLVLLHGKRGIGKSQWCLTLGHAIVNKLKLFHQYKTIQAPVVFVQADMTPMIQQRRVQRLNGMARLDGVWYAFPHSCNVERFHSSDPLVQSIAEVEPGLIVWDTLRKIHRLPENKSESVQIVYESLKAWFPGPSHLLIHHDRKSQIDDHQLEKEEAFRGSGDWIDSVDTSIQLIESTDSRNRSAKRITMHIHKCRTMAEEERNSLLLEMDQESLLLYPVADTLVTKDLRALLEECPGLTKTEQVEELMRRGVCTRRIAAKTVASLDK